MKKWLAVICVVFLLLSTGCVNFAEAVTSNEQPKHDVARRMATACGPMDRSYDKEALTDVRALVHRDLSKLFGHVPDAIVTDVQVYTHQCTVQSTRETLANAFDMWRLLRGTDAEGWHMVILLGEHNAYWVIIMDNVIVIVDLGRDIPAEQRG